MTVGTLGEMKRENSLLVDYGIQNEASDLRAHVCVLARKVYVFRTSDALSVLDRGIQTGRYNRRFATQPGVNFATASGYAVPVGDLRVIPVSAIRAIEAQGFSERDSTSVKGQKAVNVVTQLLRAGWFPLLAVRPDEVSDYDLQVSGVDVLVSGRWHIQVKCDYKGGEGAAGCTGRLFLQTQECNPLRAV